MSPATKGNPMTLPTYNGWPNYPTWNVALWMDNEEGSYSYARELAHTAIDANSNDYSDLEVEVGETLTLPDGTMHAGRLQRDDNGAPIVDIAECGTCGFQWNDTLITGITPVPS